ncbi:MAG: hypothetical protein FJ301_02315 [Planctomycetes bacterium]|nr:hypothetical protein [Planctomycetota bacterium]
MRRVRMWIVVVLAVLGAKMWWQNRDVAYAQPAAPVVTFGDRVAAIADGAVLDLAQVQPGDWETAHVVGPYTTAEALQERLGFAAPMANAVCTQDEGRQSLLFVRGIEVVAWHALPRSRGDFCRAPANERGVARADAKFLVSPTEDGWRAFVLQAR